jgi:small subunit ribosomal protein S16
MIRLARTGATKKPNYRVVVIEKERARDGRFLEILGHYDPRKNPATAVLNSERVEYWLGKGAQPSDTVRGILKRHKSAAETATAATA